MNSDEMANALVGLFREAYDGTDSSFFSDGGKGSLLGTLTGLSAEQASRPVTVDGLTIAAHAEHLRWSLANLNAAAKGAPWNPDWSSSWLVRHVDASAWDALRSALQHEYEATLEFMGGLDVGSLGPMMFSGTVATIAHAAYHLGAIRASLKSGSETA